MISRLGIVSILLLLISNCFAASCRTCRGQECQQKDLQLTACNKFSSTLPFGTHTILPKNKENLQYGCLKLEYIHGKSTEIVQKCIIAENINTYCEDIAKKIFHTSCKVETPIILKTKRETNSLLVQPIEATNNGNRDNNVTGTDTFTDYFSMNTYYNITKFPPVSTPHKDEITRSTSTISCLEVNTTRYNDLTETTTKHYFKNESGSTKNISLNSTAANFGSLTMQPNDSSVVDEAEGIVDNGNMRVFTTAHSIALEHHNENLTINTTHLFPEVISYITTTGYNNLTEITTEHYIKNESESTTNISLDLTTEKVYTDNITTYNFGSSTMQPSDSSFGDETEDIVDNGNLPVITTARSVVLEDDNNNFTVSTTHLFPEVISNITTTGYNDFTETTNEHYIKNQSESTTNISLDLTTEKVYTDNITTDNFGSSTMQPNDSSVGDEIKVIDDNGNLPVITTAQSIAPEHDNNNLEVSTTHSEVISYTTTTGYNDLTETTNEHYINNQSESTTDISLDLTTQKVYTDNITTDNFGFSTMRHNDSSVGDEIEVIDDNGNLPVITTTQSIAPEHDNNNLEVSTTHLFPGVISYTTTTGYNDLTETTTDHYIKNESESTKYISLDLTTEKVYTDKITTDNFGSSTIQQSDSSFGNDTEVIDDNGNLPVITTARSVVPVDDNNNFTVSTTHLFPEVISNITTISFTETTNEHYIKNQSESTTNISLDLTTEKVYTDNITTDNFGSSTMQPNDSSVGDEIEVTDDNGNLPVITTAQSIAPEHDNNNLEVSTTHLFPEVISYSTTTGYNDLTETTTEHYIKNESESTTNISLDLTTEKVYTDKITTDSVGSSTMQPNESSVGDEIKVTVDNGSLPVTTTVHSIVLEYDNDSLSISTTYLFPEVITNSTISTIFPSNGVGADHSNSDWSTEVPSNIPSFENTTQLIIIEISDSILIDEDDQFTQTEASDHAQVPFDSDHDGDHNSALKIEFPFILCAALFVIYTVVS